MFVVVTGLQKDILTEQHIKRGNKKKAEAVNVRSLPALNEAKLIFLAKNKEKHPPHTPACTFTMTSNDNPR